MSTQFIDDLVAAAVRAPSADNSQPFQLQWDGRALQIRHAVRHPEYNVFGPDSHATLLSIGTLVETLQQLLAANGVTATLQWGSPDGQPYATLVPDSLPAAFTLVSAVLQRHTNRQPYRRDALVPEVLAATGTLAEGGNRITLLQDGPGRKRLVDAVLRSAEARFCNRRLHEWLIGSLRRTPAQVASGDGLDVATLGLPPGGAMLLDFIADWRRMEFLNGLGAYKLLARSEIALIAQAPVLLCLTGPSSSEGVLAAGQLLARAWMQLNQHGVAVHPYYVVTDQVSRLHDGTLATGFEDTIRAVEGDLARQLGLAPGERLQMILRLGYPRKPVAALSRRLPLAELFRKTA